MILTFIVILLLNVGGLKVPLLKHAWREQNWVIDCLAMEGMESAQNSVLKVFTVPPLCGIEAFEADSIGTTFVRKILTCNVNL